MDREKLEGIFAQENLSPATRRAYVGHLLAFFDYLNTHYVRPNEKRLTRAEIAGYLQHLERKRRGAATIGAHAWALKAYLRAIGSTYRMQDIQLPRVGRRETPGALEKNEARRILRDAERWNARNAALVAVLLYTGVRVGELVALDLDDITLGERKGSARIRHGKGNKERYVPIPPEARVYLRRYLAERGEPGAGPLFVTNRGRRIGARHVRAICAELGTHPHAFRHTYGRALTAAGVDLAQVAQLMGHANIATTSIYAIPTDVELEETVSRVFGG